MGQCLSELGSALWGCCRSEEGTASALKKITDRREAAIKVRAQWQHDQGKRATEEDAGHVRILPWGQEMLPRVKHFTADICWAEDKQGIWVGGSWGVRPSHKILQKTVQMTTNFLKCLVKLKDISQEIPEARRSYRVEGTQVSASLGMILTLPEIYGR